MDAVTRYKILDADSTGCCKIEITTTLSTENAAEFERCVGFLDSTIGDALFTKGVKLSQQKVQQKGKGKNNDRIRN